MNRKTKILMTISTLFVCFALFSFGVYAAVTSISYTISGTVSYEVQDVAISLSGNVKYVKNLTKSFANFDAVALQSGFENHPTLQITNFSNYQNGGYVNTNQTVDSLAINFNQSTIFMFEYSIESLNIKDVSVVPTIVGDLPNNTGISFATQNGNVYEESASIKVDAKSSNTLYVFVYVKNINQTVNNENWNINFLMEEFA